MASCLPQNPWTVESGFYTCVDGSVIYITGGDNLLGSVNTNLKAGVDTTSVECHTGKSETGNKTKMDGGAKEDDK
jgi:hypothetical protein